MKASRQTICHLCNGHRTLVITAKAARPGMVKTRLARSLPVRAVTALYRCLLDNTIALGRSLDGVEVGVMCPETDLEDLERAVGNKVPVVQQMGNGLAAALASVFAHFGAAAASRIVAFNSNSPHLPTSVTRGRVPATRKLRPGRGTHSARASYPGLLTGDAMGTANVVDALLTRALAGLSVHLTRPFYDIDVAPHLSRLAEEVQLIPAKAPKTPKWLSECASAGHANKGF